MSDTTNFENWRSKGFERLVPVMPPDALTDEPRDAGKKPAFKGEDGKWRGLSKWSHMHPARVELQQWQEWGANVGLINTAEAFAIDCDAHDPAVAKHVYDLAEMMLGPAPVRVGRPPKFALLYRCTGELVRRVLRFDSTPDRQSRNELDRVEIPAQLVIGGLHPVTRQNYAWPIPPKHASDLTAVTPEALEGFFQILRTVLPSASAMSSSIVRDEVDQQGLRGDRETVAKAVRATPNVSQHFGYDEWVRMAAAIRGALPDDEAFGCQLFREFSERTDKVELTEDPDRVYWSVQPPFGVGADYIVQTATRLSNFAAELWFEEPKAQASVHQERPPEGKFRVRRIAELMDQPRRPFLIDRFIPVGGLGFIYGVPGSYKSFLALDMALHMAYSMSRWHCDDYPTLNPGPVVYVAGEGVQGAGDRLKSWLGSHFELPGIVDQRFGVIGEPTDFMDIEILKKLSDTIASEFGERIGMLFVDTVSRAIPGADENAQKEMSMFVAGCDALRFRFGSTTIGIHHESAGGRLRGSTVFPGAADFILHCRATKEDREGTLWLDKQKDGYHGDGWGVDFRMTRDGASLVPTLLTGGEAVEVVFEEDMDDEEEEDAKEAAEAA